MTLNEAFDNLKAARRKDDGSVKAANHICQAAIDVAWEAFSEHLTRSEREPTNPKPDPFSFENVKNLLGQ
jgi:hypothetical protein